MNTSLKLALPVLLFLAFFQSPTPSGPAPPVDTDDFCAQAELHRQKLQEDATYRLATQRLEEQLYALAQQPPAQRGPSSTFILPVVFHIIHDNGAENISNAEVEAALDRLNQAFANTGYYNPATGVDTEISFCLARRSPENGPTTGILRVQSPLTDLNYITEDQALKNLSRWPSRDYINIWLVRDICRNNGCAMAGYAYLPSAHGTDYDGIVVEARYMNADPANATVLVHEMGHYLGLYHTFSGGCLNNNCLQQGDRICDTPPDNTTANTPCEEPVNSCTTDQDDTSPENPFRPTALGGLGDQPDRVENYMDYSRLSCYDRFSEGQKDRMLNVAETIRYSLLESSACLEPCPEPPLPAFTASTLSVQVGSTVSFINTSSHASNYEWHIDGTLFSNDVNPSYTFTQAGNFTITLTAISTLENCQAQDTSLAIEVICPVESNFLPNNATLAVGEAAAFSYSGSNANTFSWLIDGTIAGNGEVFNLEASEPGNFSLCLEAGNGLCSNISCAEVEVTGLKCETTFAVVLGLEAETETGAALLPARDGGFYLGGSIGTDALLLKFDENDQVLWQKRFSIASGSEVITQLLEDGNHLAGIVTVDSTWSYCFRYNLATENLDWVRRFDGPEPVKLSALLLPPGQMEYIILGQVGEPVNGTRALAWITVGAQSGMVLQVKAYVPEGRNATVSDAFVLGNQVFCAGSYQVSNGIARIRPSITKFNLQGDEEWGRIYLRPTSYPALLYARAIIPDGEELVAIGDGTSLGIGNNHIAHVFKTTAEGALLWASRFDGIAAFRAIHRLRDGFLLIEDGGANRIIKIDESGNSVWARTLRNSESTETTRYHHSSFIRRGYLYLTGSSIEAYFEGIFLAKIPVEEEVLNSPALCLLDSIRPSTTSSFSPPYEGEHPLSMETLALPNSSSTAPALGLSLQQDTLCHISCFEICYNGQDDDHNGAVDCEEEACGCTGCSPTFVKTLGSEGDTIGVATMILSNDGSIYLGGYDKDKAMIARMSLEGDVLWWRTFDCSPGPDRIAHLQLDDEGMLFGINQGKDIGLPLPNSVTNAFRYDPETGIFLWVSDNLEQTLLFSIIHNPVTGDYLACGAKEGIDFFGDDAGNPFITELEGNNGEILWSKTIDNPDFIYSYSFSSIDVAGGLIHCSQRNINNGNFYNNETRITTFEQGGVDARSLQCFPGNNIYSVTTLTTDENQLVGVYQSEQFTINSVTGLFKTKADGGLGWIRQYRLEGYDYLQADSSLLKTPDGYLLYGIGYRQSFTTDLVLIKTNHRGEALWAIAYGGEDRENIVPVAGPNLMFQFGENIYFAGRKVRDDGLEQALIVQCKANGTLEGTDCNFARPVPVSTLGLAPISTEGPRDFLDWNETSPPGSFQEDSDALPEDSFLCEPLPCLDTCYYDFIVQVDSTACAGDSMAVRLQLCNTGSTAYAGNLPLSVYLGNPTTDSSAARLNTFVLPAINLDSGACQTLNLLLPFSTAALFVIANDDGSQAAPFNLETDFPLNELEECSYINNMDSFIYQGIPPLISLGPDTIVCENSVVVLDAGPGYASYRWQDGFPERTYTATEPGTYWVEVSNQCGDTGRDSITIRQDTAIAIGLSANVTSLCIGDTLRLSVPEVDGYTYQWSPTGGLSCNTCTTTIARPLESTTYSVVAANSNGCISVDTLLIQVEGCGRLLDTALCQGSFLEIEGQAFYPGPVDSVQLGTDSLLYIRISALDTFYSRLDTALCQEQSLLYEGVELQPGQTEWFTFTARNGCDSTVEVNVLPLGPISADIIATDISCAGFQDGMIVIESPTGGQPPYQYRLDGAGFQPESIFTGLPAGSYTVFIRDGQGCELSREIQLNAPLPLQLLLPKDQTLKLGDSLRLTPFITGATELVYTWSPIVGLSCPTCREPVAAPLESTLYRLDIVDKNGCATSDDILLLIDKTASAYIPNAFSPNGDGQNDRLLLYPGPAVEAILSFRIFSRWGELVFEAKDFSPGEGAGWDGTFQGQPMMGGIYVYQVELRLKDGRREAVKGEVVLVR